MTRLRLIALALPLLFAAACKQGKGERCQVQSDCDSAYVCVIPAGGTAASGGSCELPTSGSTDMAVTGTSPDLATTAASTDMAMAHD